jgi:hypothetical protein
MFVMKKKITKGFIYQKLFFSCSFHYRYPFLYYNLHFYSIFLNIIITWHQLFDFHCIIMFTLFLTNHYIHYRFNSNMANLNSYVKLQILLPYMVGRFIPENEEYWHNYLQLYTCCHSRVKTQCI